MIIIAVIIAVLGIVGVGIGVAMRGDAKRHNDGDEQTMGTGVAGLGIGGIVIAILLALAASYVKVGSGEVGIEYGVGGNIVGQVGPGGHFIAPWNHVSIADVKTQHAEFDHLTAFSKETQPVYLDITLNYSVSPRDIQQLYAKYGAGWFDTLVPSRVNNDAKEETVKYKALDVAPNREKIRSDIATQLEHDLGRDSLIVSAVQIKNIGFDPSFQTSIVAKQTAQQKAQQATFQAQQKVAQARGEAESTLIQAKAQAQANTKLAHSITPTLVQYQLVQKLAPSITTIAPANGLFNLGQLAARH